MLPTHHTLYIILIYCHCPSSSVSMLWSAQNETILLWNRNFKGVSKTQKKMCTKVRHGLSERRNDSRKESVYNLALEYFYSSLRSPLLDFPTVQLINKESIRPQDSKVIITCESKSLTSFCSACACEMKYCSCSQLQLLSAFTSVCLGGLW